jgi:hypothetical protein
MLGDYKFNGAPINISDIQPFLEIPNHNGASLKVFPYGILSSGLNLPAG